MPENPSMGAVMSKDGGEEVAGAFISVKLAKALANPLRSRILMELSARPMSPSQFAQDVGGELSAVARAFRQLAGWGYIEIAAERRGGRRRGGVEHVYRTARPAHLDTPTWETLPKVFRDDFSQNILASYLARISEALEADTFDAETDRHLSWDSVLLDREAFVRLTDRLDEVLASLPLLAAESAERLERSGEAPIPTTVGLAAFRSPTEEELADARSAPGGPG
jgi:DNA-binding transcriptional ArsR family regulator